MTIFIESQGYRFGVNTENDHNGDWREEAAEAMKPILDGMTEEKVAAIHANIKSVESGQDDEFIDEYWEATNAASLVNEYEDFIVTLSSE